MKVLNETILLRKPELEDVEYLYILKNDIEPSLFLGGFSTGYTKESLKNWINFHNNAANEVLYVIVDISTEQLIGHVGLYNIDYRIRKAEFAILIANKE